MGIRKTLKKWAAYQQTVRELAALDNRQLNDLGHHAAPTSSASPATMRAASKGSPTGSSDDCIAPNTRFLLRSGRSAFRARLEREPPASSS